MPRFDFREASYGPLSITVDGQEVADRCFLVDTEAAGEAHCYVSTETMLLDEDGNLRTEVLKGQVVVTPLYAWTPSDLEALRSLGISPEDPHA